MPDVSSRRVSAGTLAVSPVSRFSLDSSRSRYSAGGAGGGRDGLRRWAEGEAYPGQASSEVPSAAVFSS